MSATDRARQANAREALEDLTGAADCLAVLADDVEEDEVGMSVEDVAALVRVAAGRVEAILERLTR